MAPEQAHGGATDVRADIFSLGLVLLRMALGYLPERAAPDVASTAGAGTPAVISAVGIPGGEVPDAIARVVCRATAVRPQERYQSAVEMRVDLHAAARTLGRNDWRRWLPT